MKTPNRLTKGSGNNQNGHKSQSMIALLALIVSFSMLIAYISISIAGNRKRPSNIKCRSYKRLRFKRSIDSCKVELYLSFENKGDISQEYSSLFLRITSLQRIGVQIRLEADSVERFGKCEPVTQLVIGNTPVTGTYHFIGPIDSAQLSNMPQGKYSCQIEGIEDSSSNVKILYKFETRLDRSDVKKLRGINTNSRKSGDGHTTYQALELNIEK